MRRPLRPVAPSLGDASGRPRNGPDSKGPELPPSQETGEVRSRAIHLDRTGQPSTPAREGAEDTMKTTVLQKLFLSLLSAFVFCSSSFAQGDIPEAHLQGTLLDVSGAGVGGVRITAQLEGVSETRVWAAASSADGAYGLALPAGRYHVQFSRAPFVTRDLVVDLSASQQRKLDLRLNLERLSDSVVVTAQAEPVATEATPYPVTVISRNEIERRQSVSLPDLLALQPGISLARTGSVGGLATVFIDGGNSTFTKVLIDGTPVNEPGGFLNFSNFTLDNVEKVEIVHGAESALYGSDAVSGVIQVFTRRGTTRLPAVNLFGEGGSFASARGGADVSGLLGRFDYSAGAAYFHSDGQGVNDAFLNRTLSGAFGWRFSEVNQVRLVLRNQSSDAEIPRSTLLPPANTNQSDFLHLFAANLGWNFHTGSHWAHHLSGTESRTRDANTVSIGSTFLDLFNRAGLQEQSTYFFRTGSATGGYQYEVENGFPSLLFPEHARRNNQAGFLDGRWQPFSRLTLNAGVRAEANDNFGTRVVPRMGAAVILRYGQGFWGDTRLRASYGKGIKEPALEQSFGSDPCFPGNPNLHPERSRTVYAGVEQVLASQRVRLTAGYFNNRFEDMISFAFGASTLSCTFGTGTYFNTDLARARGMNFSLEAKPLRWLTMAGNYSYDNTRVLKAPNVFFEVNQPGNPLLRRPLHSGSLTLNAVFRRMSWTLSGYFSGKRADSDFQGLGLLIPNPGYARFDLATSYELFDGLFVFGRAANLFDKHYQDALGFPALGRDFRVGMRYRFSGKN
jgi:vitamin B12 transporter